MIIIVLSYSELQNEKCFGALGQRNCHDICKSKHYLMHAVRDTLLPLGEAMGDQEEEDSPQLLRTRSDASFMQIQRRSKTHSARDLQRLRTHRFSINGHFYNHKVP